jgi:hypothetical protein
MSYRDQYQSEFAKLGSSYFRISEVVNVCSFGSDGDAWYVHLRNGNSYKVEAHIKDVERFLGLKNG